MGFFQKCPHTCVHSASARNRPTYDYIFYNVGSSFNNHMKSQLHPNCNAACPAHPEHPQMSRSASLTTQDWTRWANDLWSRYAKNAEARAVIPKEYLNPANQQEALAISGHSEPVEEEEGEKGEKGGEGEGDKGGEKGREDNADLDAKGGAEIDPQAQFEDPASNFMAVGSLLVDRAVSPVRCSSGDTLGSLRVDRAVSPVRCSSGDTFEPSPPASPSPAPSTISGRLGDFETPWVDPLYFSGTPFFTDPLIVAFVEDPTRRTTKTKAQRYDSWMCNNLTISDKWHDRFMMKFPQLAFQIGNKAMRFWWEWLGIVHALADKSGPGCKVKLISWEDYKEALLSGEGKVWEDMAAADLVIGGLHLEWDFMNATMYDTIEPVQVDAWMANLRSLTKQTIVYPSPDQMLLRGSKLYVVDQLREIAQSVTYTSYPEIVLIDNPLDPDLAARPGLFIKRSFSDSAKHVVRPSNAKDAAQLSEMVAETNKYYGHEPLRKLGVQPRWFGMAFIPEMSEKGEIRVIFIGGKLSYMISTQPEGENLRVLQAYEVTPLCCLSKTKAHTAATTSQLHDSDLPSYLQRQGSQEFSDFITRTYYGLIHTDERILDGSQLSDLRVFCRIDASVYMDSAGAYHFYVNEISATQRAGLFLGYLDRQAPRIVTDFANALRALVAVRRARHAESEDA